MSAATPELRLDIGGRGSPIGPTLVPISRTRRVGALHVARSSALRAVEYSAYPRALRCQRVRVGFTRDASGAGIALAAEESEKVGALLRVVLSGVDGRPYLDSLARVVSCMPRGERRFRIALTLVGPPRELQRGLHSEVR